MNSKSNNTKTLGVTGFSKENPEGNPFNSNRVTGAKNDLTVDAKTKTYFDDIIISEKGVYFPVIKGCEEYFKQYQFDIIDDTKLEEASNSSDITFDTTKEGDNSYKIDWLSFTFPVEYFDEVFQKIMVEQFKYSSDDFEDAPPKNYYNTTKTIGNYVNIMYNIKSKPIKGNTSDTVNIVFTGQGMSDLRNRVGSFIGILKTVWAIPNVSIARIDIAFDSFHKKSEVPRLDLISKKLDLKEYKSPKRSHNIIKEEDSEGNIYGHSAYIGSRSSSNSYYCRVYSKYHQYLYNKNSQLPDIVQQTRHWERWELVFSKQKATNIVDTLLNNPRYQYDINLIFKEMLGLLITFLEPTRTRDGKLQRKTRWKTCEWWTKFLESDKKYEFTKIDLDANFALTLHWVANAIAPTINVLNLILKEYGYDFIDMLKKYPYKKELSKKHTRLIKDAMLNSQDKVNDLVSQFMNGEMQNLPRAYYREANNEDLSEK